MVVNAFLKKRNARTNAVNILIVKVLVRMQTEVLVFAMLVTMDAATAVQVKQ
jgi:hypothetical protein